MKKHTKTDILWLICFLFLFAMILYKCNFGFANRDESFYLTIPYRLVQGDDLFLHEWHLSQMAFVLVYPFLKVYLFFANSTEGIHLVFRYFFTVLHGLTAVFLYIRLRKVNYGAFFISLSYLAFVPYGIMALCYNSMGLALMVISCVLLYTNYTQSKAVYILAGLSFSGAVLCNPYLVLLYAFYAAATFYAFFQRKFTPLRDILPLSGFWMFTVGCFCAAFAFLLFLFRNTAPFEIKDFVTKLTGSLGYIFSDPEHPSKSIIRITTQYFEKVFLRSNSFAKPVFLCCAILLAMFWLDKNRKHYVKVYLFLACALIAVYFVPFVTFKRYLNYMMFPLAVIGFFCFCFSGGRFLAEFVLLWVPSIVYGYCMNWSSNQGFYVISNASALASFAGILMLVSLCSQISKEDKSKLFDCLAILFLSVFVICVSYLRYNMLFWETRSMAGMTARISVGCEKGILASETHRDFYEELYHDSEPVRNYDGDTVLYFSKYTWLYLDDTKTNAAYSGWLSGVNNHSAKRLVGYYELNPEKLPDIVYGIKEDWEAGEYLLEYLNEHGYQQSETELGYIYTKP